MIRWDHLRENQELQGPFSENQSPAIHLALWRCSCCRVQRWFKITSVHTGQFHLASRDKGGLKNMGQGYCLVLSFGIWFISNRLWVLQTSMGRGNPGLHFTCLCLCADISSCEVKNAVRNNSSPSQGETSLNLLCTEVNGEKRKNQILGFCMNQLWNQSTRGDCCLWSQKHPGLQPVLSIQT